MKKNKMFRAAFKALNETDIKTTDDLTVALNNMFSSLGLPSVPDPAQACSAAPQSDVSFDSISNILKENGIED